MSYFINVQAYGFTLYRTILKKDAIFSPLDLSGLRDRGYVLIDGVSIGRCCNKSLPSFSSKINKCAEIEQIEA